VVDVDDLLAVINAWGECPGTCQPEWQPTFGTQPATDFSTLALAVFDDGSGTGPMLYAGGSFTSAGAEVAGHVAKWNGISWSAVGGGINGDVNCLAVFDDGSGSGPALYAGGLFNSAGEIAASNIAKWDGRQWSALGSGVSSVVNALAVFDDGSGAGPA